MESLPDEIVFKIISYLPSEVLIALNLSNHQYWEIYRTTVVENTTWDSKTVWLEKLFKTNEMYLDQQIYVQSLFSLEVGYPPDTYTPKIPAKNGLVVFRQLLDGYVWYPPNLPTNFIDIKQVLNEADTTTPPFAVDTSCSNIILNVFNKHVLKYATSCIPSYDGYSSEEWTDEEGSKVSVGAVSCNLGRKCKRSNGLEKLEEFPDDVRIEIPLVLYIREDKLDNVEVNGHSEFVKYELDFADKMKVGKFIIWKVLKDKQDIGRAVLSPCLHIMMEKHIVGVALFANQDNQVYGFGNFNVNTLKKFTQASEAFKKHHFAIVKENIHNREPIEQWLVDARNNGIL